MKIKPTVIIAVILLAVCLCAASADGPALKSWSKENGWQYVQFGRYPTEKDGTAAPILWRVLRAGNGEAYLLSEYILDARRVDGNKNAYPGWESSEMYQWLNSAFAETAFTAQEALALKVLPDGGKISLLTADESKDENLGFRDLPDRCARATAWAKAQGIDVYSGGVRYSPWWLRDVSTDNANMQRRVIDQGKLGRGSVPSKDQGVRPCVLIDTGMISVAGGSGAKDDPCILSVSAFIPLITPAPEITEAPATRVPVEGEFDVEDQPEATPAVPSSPAAYATDTPAETAESGAIIASKDGISPLFPALAADGFLPDGQEEFVYQDEDSGVWLYASRTLRVEIHRRAEEEVPHRWYEAEIWCKPESDMFTTYAFDEAKYKNYNRQTNPQDIAKQHHLVFAMNTDFFIYRVERDHEESYDYPIGIVIRRGSLMYDRPKKATSTVYPPLDVMALYPDGEMKTFLNAETTGKALLEDGATDVLSFGPVLMQNGEIIPRATAYGEIDNPRTAFGYVSRGHYYCVLMEGRMSKTYSKGASCGWMANTMARLGCQTALNLDGGQTACMMFMGKRINKIGTYDGKTTDKDRKQNEVLGIGQSSLVGN